MADFRRLARAAVLVLGRAGMDLYADPPGTRTVEAARFFACLGGSSANVAVALVRQGLAAGLLSCVSDDAVGGFCLAELDRHGVDRRHVRVVGGDRRTSLAVVETRLHDCQSVIYRNGAADFALEPADVAAVDWAAWSALAVSGTALAAEPSRAATFAALERAGAAGLPRILDIDYRPYSWPSTVEAASVCARAAALCEVVVGNDVEFAVLAGAAGDGLSCARDLAARGAAIVVHKMGEHGAITLAGGAEVRTGIYPTRALKPTGAGDAFLGGLIAGLAGGHGVEAAVLRGSAAAAIVVGRVGCAPAMPTAGEIDALVARGPALEQP